MAGVGDINPYDIYSGPQSPESPGGFVFGQQGWMWGNPRPKSITFFLDGTAKVNDQYGRPIRGVVDKNGRSILFAQEAPKIDGHPNERSHYAKHQEVIEALDKEGVKWEDLAYAGFPQIPYDELKKLKAFPPTPIKELRKITDPALRAAAIKARREADEARRAELHPEETEE